MRILGFIPARSGSKGVKNKNIKKIKGIPLLEFSIYAAEKSMEKGYINEILVSTDSKYYLELLSKYNIIKDYLRPSNLATDKSPTIDSVIHGLNWLRDEKGKVFDAVMILQPTTPFRTPDHINEAIRLLQKNKLSTCVASIKRLADHHPKRIKLLNEKGQLLDYCYHAKEPEPSRRQDFLPPAFIRNGAIYLTRTKYLFEKKLIRGDHVIGMEMPESNSINIDEHFDFISASAALEYEEFNKDLEFFVNFINSRQKTIKE